VDPSLLVTHREPLDGFAAALEPTDGRMRVKAVIEPPRDTVAAGAAASRGKESQ
jgi:hypothetical protein